MRVDTKRLAPVVRSNLVRLGRENDGGYIVPVDAVEAASSLLSFGLSYDWEFERAFRRRNRGAVIRCWDHTTTRLGALRHGKFLDYRSFFRDEAVHVRRRIGPEGTGAATIADAFASVPRGQVFVKMDIEGDEYDVWADVMRHEPSIDAMVVEFHDLDIQSERFNRCMEMAARHFHVVHVHGNNYGGTAHGFPCVVELTLEHKRCFSSEPKPWASVSDCTSPS